MIKNQIRMPLKPVFRVKSGRVKYLELKFAVRNTARELSLYFEPIEQTITVESDTGSIEVNTLGKWLFGVPGFAGHWRNSPPDKEGWVVISLPEIEEARELIRKALRILQSQEAIEKIEEAYSLQLMKAKKVLKTLFAEGLTADELRYTLLYLLGCETDIYGTKIEKAPVAEWIEGILEEIYTNYELQTGAFYDVQEALLEAFEKFLEEV